jgi:hypothetical protein
MMNNVFVLLLVSTLSAARADNPIAPGPIQDGLQLSITHSANSIGLHLENMGHSARYLTVGAHYNNADHWRVSATLMMKDGTTQILTHLPNSIVVTGYISPFTIEVRPQTLFLADVPLDDFELESPHGPSVKLSSLIGSGDRLQIDLHCGPMPIGRSQQDPWKGDLDSGWLTL